MKKIICILVLGLLIITAIPVIGQNYTFVKGNGEEKWIKTYDFSYFDSGKKVFQTNDGGYIVLGIKTRFLDTDYQIFLLKTDNLGNKIWEKTFGGEEWDKAGSIKQTSDGGYIITGYTNSFGTGYSDIWLIKTDSEGNKLWDKTFGFADSNESGQEIIELDDGGFVILGSIIFGDIFNHLDPDYNHDIWLIKTDSNGEMIWDYKYDRDDQDVGSVIHQLDDGGYIIGGDTGSLDIPGYSDILLIKTDRQGEVVWDKTFSKNDHDYGECLQITSDGGFLIQGNSYELGDIWYNIWVIKTDSDGEILWDTSFGDNGFDWGNYMQLTADGGFVITGYSVEFISKANGFLIKADSLGEQEWIKIYDRSRNDFINFVQQTSDGGYILTGSVDSVPLRSDVWLIKTDAEGNVARGRFITNSFLMRFLKRFPNAFPLLRNILEI